MKVLKDSVIYLLGELFAKAIPFLLLPYLSRRLGVAGYGELSYYQTYLALFTIFVGLSQEGAVSRYYYFYGRRGIDLVMTSGYLYATVIGVIMLIGCLVFKATILAIIVATAIFANFISVQLAVRQCQKQALAYTIIQVTNGLLSAIFTIALLEIYHSNLIEKRFLALLIANIVAFAIAYALYGKHNGRFRKFSWQKYKLGLLYVFSFGMPLLLHQLSFFMKGQLDRIFIYQAFSAAELGVYSAAIQIASVLSIIIMALNKAIVPYYYENLRKKTWSLAQIKKFTLLSLVIVPVPAIISYILPESLFLWILGNSFVGVKYYISLFLLGYGLTIPYLALVNYLFFYGKNLWIANVNLISAVIYVILLIGFTVSGLSLVPLALIISNLLLIMLLWFVVPKVSV